MADEDVIMVEHNFGLKKIYHPIQNCIGQYVQFYSGKDGEVVAGRLDRVDEDCAIFRPYVEQRFPVSGTGLPWYEFIDADLIQKIEPFRKIVVTTREDLERQMRYQERVAKKQARSSANRKVPVRQNSRQK